MQIKQQNLSCPLTKSATYIHKDENGLKID